MAPLHDATSFAETPAMLISGTPSRKDCKLERATFAFDGGWGKEGCCNMHLAGCRSSASWRVLKVDLDWRGVRPVSAFLSGKVSKLHALSNGDPQFR